VSYVARNHPQQVKVRGALSAVDDRATTWEVFNPLQERFHFTIDVAASHENKKLPRYFDALQDGLEQSWAGERVWCNPPHSDIGSWVLKAWDEWQGTYHRDEAELIVMLLPANRTEQKWWQQSVEPWRDRQGEFLRVEFLPGRLRFLAPGASAIKPNERPPYGCCLLIWGSDA
jgi:phage N-6-adenine-methyltransferase